MRGGAGAAGRGTKLASDFESEALAGEGLEGEEEFSPAPVVEIALCGTSARDTSAAGLDGAGSEGRGRGSGVERALRGGAACGMGRGGIRLGSVVHP